MFEKIKTSKYVKWSIYLAIFVFMLVSNILTLPVADDFIYLYSFETGEKILGIGDIFKSLGAHYYTMNGRLVPHFFLHLFLLLPGIVFDIVNSIMFLLLINLINSFVVKGNKSNNYVLAISVILICFFQSAFGEVFLWAAGSINYLWAMVLALIFIKPYINYFLYDNKPNKVNIILQSILAFMLGGWLENVAMAFIACAFCLLVCKKVIYKVKLNKILLIPCIFAIINFVIMITAPAELNNKFGEISLIRIFKIFIAASMEVVGIAVLIIAGLFFSRRVLQDKGKGKYVVLASIVFVWALASNYVFVIAAYYPPRNTICMLTMTLVALAILYSAIDNVNIKKLECCVLAGLMVFCCAKVAYGFYDIYECYQKTKAREQIIIEAKNSGNKIIEVENFETRTKYAVVSIVKTQKEIKDNDILNKSIAKYYEIDTIYGKE